jgi:hypothetical protein
VVDIHTAYFSDEDDCEGQDVEDEDHVFPVVSVLLAPA